MVEFRPARFPKLAGASKSRDGHRSHHRRPHKTSASTGQDVHQHGVRFLAGRATCGARDLPAQVPGGQALATKSRRARSPSKCAAAHLALGRERWALLSTRAIACCTGEDDFIFWVDAVQQCELLPESEMQPTVPLPPVPPTPPTHAPRTRPCGARRGAGVCARSSGHRHPPPRRAAGGARGPARRTRAGARLRRAHGAEGAHLHQGAD